MKHH